MDFAIGSNIPSAEQVLITEKHYLSQAKSEDYVPNVLHAEPGIGIYIYQRPGIRAVLFKNSSGISVKDINLSGNMIPKELRSRKYLFELFEIKEGVEPLLGCDLWQMKLSYSGDALDSLEITSSLD